jgi:predicted acyl esterase
MLIDWDVPIVMRDGNVLRADVFRPSQTGAYPVLMTHGPYAKGLAFQDGFPEMWQLLADKYPDALAGSSNELQAWETPDPEKWVPHGYVCVRVDSRGSGRSPGYLDIFSPQETRDFYDCIEWAGVQPWSSGRVGLLGISYYAMNQWQVAALRPPHLAAICPWEGSSDFYREFVRHGGILSSFHASWYPGTVLRVQHGLGERGDRSRVTGELICGPETLSQEELADKRADYLRDLRARPLIDDYYRDRTPVLEDIEVPVLSSANWAHHLHTRGNFGGYLAAGTAQKWLEVHGRQHWVEFYTDYGVRMQRQFFDHFLKGDDNDWRQRAPVTLNIRHVDGSFALRDETAWPLSRTVWTELYLDCEADALASAAPVRAAEYEISPGGSGATFRSAPLAEETEITGPLAAKLFVSTSATDVDVFVTLRVLSPDGTDVTLPSAVDPHGVLTTGWLRASHRRLDPHRSTPYRPWHTHDRIEMLEPNQTVELDIEILPTSIVVPAGHLVAVTLTGRDFAFDGPGPWPCSLGIDLRGNGIILHDDPTDRPAETFNVPFTVRSGGPFPSRLLLPIVPASIAAATPADG